MMRFGLIGAGGAGAAYAQAVEETGRGKVVAVADPSETNRSKVAEAYGARAFTNEAELLQGDLDAAIIATPPFLHARQVIAALEKGLHVICEKPMTIRLEDAEKIMDVAQAKRKVVAVGYQLNFTNPHRRMVEIARSGDLGEILCAWVTRLSFWEPESAWLTDPSRSGGMLMECMTHEVDWLMRVGGNPVSAYGKLDAVGGIAIDRNVWAMITFDKCYATLGASWASHVGMANRGVIGTEKSLMLKDGVVMLADRNGSETLEIPAIEKGGRTLVVQDFMEAIEEGRAPCSPPDIALTNLKTCLAIHESNRTGRAVAIQ